MIRKATTQEEDKILELDFQTKREISIRDLDGPTRKYVQRKNVKPEMMLYNLTKKINWNDISDICERFCDNITNYVNRLEYLSKYLAEYTTKIKPILIANNINANKRYIKSTYSNKKVSTINNTLRLQYQRSQYLIYLH